MVDVPLVIGVDAGATTTRCVLATMEGEILAITTGAGANRWSSGEGWASELIAVVDAALVDVDSTRVAAGWFGVSGVGEYGDRRIHEDLAARWHERGLAGIPTLVGDTVVAYAAGCTEPEGLLLLAGTGAVATWVREFTTRHRCDGVGWWLGDEGSAVWLGRAALRAVLAAADGRGPDTTLTPAVTDAILGTRTPDRHGIALVDALVADTYRRAPAELGRLAPLVGTHAEAGDPVAAAIVAEAAERLVATLTAVTTVASHAGSGELPVVLAGSVLTNDTPVARNVISRVRGNFALEPRLAHDTAAGAAALAIRSLLGSRPHARVAHTRLLDTRP